MRALRGACAAYFLCNPTPIPKQPRNASERARERSERSSQRNAPSRPREEPEDPGGKAAIPGGVQSVQEGPRSVINERVDGTNAPSRDTGPGGHLEVLGSLKDVEGNPDSANVVEDTVYDGKRPKSIRDTHDVETNVLRRDGGPGGHRDKEDKSGDIDGEQERRSDRDSVEMDRTGCRMDGATSGTRRDSKRVET